MSTKNIQINIPGWALITAALILVVGLGISTTEATGRFNIPLSWILSPSGESIDSDNDAVIDEAFIPEVSPGLGQVLNTNNYASSTAILGLATSSATSAAATVGYVGNNVPDACFQDEDGDGYTPCENDCDDTATSVNPGVNEGDPWGNSGDGIDNDCDGTVDECGDPLDYCSNNSDATTTICGDLFYCDTYGRAWTITANVDGSASQKQWYTSDTDTADSCIGQGSDFEACHYCDTLDYASSTNWELPSCTDDSNLPDSCNLYQFGESACGWTGTDGSEDSCTPSWDGNAQSNDYWSSTENSSYTSYAWNVSFDNGGVKYSNKSYTYYVRCVLGQ